MNFLKKWRGEEGGGNVPVQVRRGRRGGGSQLPAPPSLANFRRELERLFDRLWHDFDRGWGDGRRGLRRRRGDSELGWPSFSEAFDWPAVDMAEDEKAITLKVDVPGLEPRDLDVEVSGNLLTLRGSREEEHSGQEAGLYHRERRSGSFCRTIPLPPYAQPDKAEAKYEKGTLTLTIPKIPGEGPKKVPVSE